MDELQHLIFKREAEEVKKHHKQTRLIAIISRFMLGVLWIFFIFRHDLIQSYQHFMCSTMTYSIESSPPNSIWMDVGIFWYFWNPHVVKRKIQWKLNLTALQLKIQLHACFCGKLSHKNAIKYAWYVIF